MAYRPRLLGEEILRRIRDFPIVAITGPRQSGKTTLARHILPDWRYVNLEDLDHRDYAQSDPRAFLADHGPRTVIDEFQRVPELASYLQGVVDRHGRSGQYLLTGSQGHHLHSRLSQSLAGRVALLTLLPFSREELPDSASPEEVLLDGGFPSIVVERRDRNAWFASYLATYVERDVRQLHSVQDLIVFQRFIRLAAHRVGQLVNYSSLARDTGVSQPTAKSWLSLLEAGYVIKRLSPWFSNSGKRLVKSPKLYFNDTGLLCHLLGVKTEQQLSTHPSRGSIFENWVLTELSKGYTHRGRTPEIYFWRDVRGEEIDFLLECSPGIAAIEVKSGRTLQSSHFDAIHRWKQTRTGSAPDTADAGEPAFLIHLGEQSQTRQGIRAVPWTAVKEVVQNCL